MDIVVDEEGHHHAVGKRTGRTDGYQGIHIGISVEKGLEASNEKVPSTVEHRDGQKQLQNGKIHAMRVHIHKFRHRQRGEAKGQHLAHGHIQQHRREDAGDDEFRFLAFQGGFFRVCLLCTRFLLFLLLLAQSRAKTGFFHFFDNLLRCDFRFIVADGHDACCQVHIAALHALKAAGHTFYRGAAGSTVHSADLILFFPHKDPPS